MQSRSLGAQLDLNPVRIAHAQARHESCELPTRRRAAERRIERDGVPRPLANRHFTG